MGLFNLFSKKVAPDTTAKRAESRDFISDLVDYFKSKSDVEAAYLGLVPLQDADAPVLFLAVSHFGDENALQGITWMAKSTYLPDLEMMFASNRTQKDVFEYVKANNFAFYQKGVPLVLHESILRQWLEPEKYGNDFHDLIMQSEVSAVVHKLQPDQATITFQSYMKDGQEFMPLFSSDDMIDKCGLAEVPEDLNVISFNFKTMNETISGGLNGKRFIVNPGTSFETMFIG
jgi:hypothetical protein